MPQTRREQKYLEDFRTFTLEDKRSDYLYALKYLVNLLRTSRLPPRVARRTKRIKRSI